jgi:hypothetical protein
MLVLLLMVLLVLLVLLFLMVFRPTHLQRINFLTQPLIGKPQLLQFILPTTPPCGI